MKLTWCNFSFIVIFSLNKADAQPKLLATSLYCMNREKKKKPLQNEKVLAITEIRFVEDEFIKIAGYVCSNSFNMSKSAQYCSILFN